MSHTDCVVCDFLNHPKCTGYYIGVMFVHGHGEPLKLNFDMTNFIEQRCPSCLRYDCWCYKDFEKQSEDEKRMILNKMDRRR